MPRSKNKLTEMQISQLVNDLHNNDVNVYAREIFLVGYANDTGDESGMVDFRVAQKFLKNLSLLEMMGWAKITIKMCIEGGSWEFGMAIFDAIRAAKSHIDIIAFGLASSMSGVILQAADTRIMMPGTHFMAHHGSVGLDTTSPAALSIIQFNSRECEKMLNIFAERCVNGQFFATKKWGVKKVAEYLDNEMRQCGDWLMTASEAVSYGFADKIYGID